METENSQNELAARPQYYSIQNNDAAPGCPTFTKLEGGMVQEYDVSAAATSVPYWQKPRPVSGCSFFDQVGRDYVEQSRIAYEQEKARRLKAEQDIEDAHKWDIRFLNLAKYWAEVCSKDPSTKVGAVITKGREIVSLGYNGFPPGANDTYERLNDRDFKYATTVHAEVNAIVLAKRDLTGCTLYTSPFEPCSRCAGIVIRAGIKRVVYPKLTDPGLIERWGKSLEATHQMFDEAGIEKKEIIMERV